MTNFGRNVILSIHKRNEMSGNSYRENGNSKFLWEIFVPTIRNDGRPIKTRFHRVWDEKVRAISKGLTVCTPVKGQWENPEDGELFVERMIPVKIACTEDEMMEILEMSKKYYEQKAMFCYLLSKTVYIV